MKSFSALLSGPRKKSRKQRQKPTNLKANPSEKDSITLSCQIHPGQPAFHAVTPEFSSGNQLAEKDNPQNYESDDRDTSDPETHLDEDGVYTCLPVRVAAGIVPVE